jgi:hypothetical protein
MNPDPDNFKQLRRLLALKRHEQPPPGYFNTFASQVVARIEKGEQVTEDFNLSFGRVPWLRWLWITFEAKPAFAGVFGAAICAVVISGIMFAEQMEPVSKPISPVASEMAPPLETSALVAMNHVLNAPQFGSSTNPVAPALSSLFNQFQVQAQPVSLNLGFPGAD